ncbi:MAG: efflux RND transporter periplasmic adaptor subunit [Vulcanimicrobiaceae bacterium]
MPVVTGVVRYARMPVIVTATGSVVGGADSMASLAFPEPGRIAHVDVVLGERVAAGETLARLDVAPYAAKAAQMRAALGAAQAAELKASSGARPQLVAQSTAQIAGARADVAAAQSNLARQQQLFAGGVVSRRDLEAAQTAAARARAQLEEYRQQRSAQVQPFAPDIAAARAGVAQARAALAEAELEVEDASLHAPFAGVVVARPHNDGESVDATMAVVQIARDGRLVFTADFAPADARAIHRGDEATIEAQGTHQRARGNVIAINPQESAATRSVAVLIRLSDAGRALGPGTYGTATIATGARRRLVVPTSAIVADPASGTTQVFRKTSDGYAPVPVAVDIRDDARTAVTGTSLRAGDVVVVEGAYELLVPSQSAPADDGK